jgi:hypothetical protein
MFQINLPVREFFSSEHYIKSTIKKQNIDI